MRKGRKLLLQPGFLANQVMPDYERKRNETIKKNNEILDSFGLKSIATSLRGSVQHKHATQNGKCSRGELDDDDYRPDDEDDEHDHDSDIELSPPPPRQSKNMKKKRYRTLDLEVSSQPNKLQNVSGDILSHTNLAHACQVSASPSTHSHSASPSTHSHRASRPSHQNGVSHLAPSVSASQPSNIHVTSQPSQVHTTLQPQPQTTQAQTILPQGIRPQCPQPQPIQPQHPIQPQSTQPQEENNFELADNMDDELLNEVDVGIRVEGEVRNKRGMTRLSEIWNLTCTTRIDVTFNNAFVPIGVEGGLLTKFIGTIARKPHLCPINYNDWHKVPKHYKETSWDIIESKFMIPENNPARDTIKRNCMKLLGTRLKDWRCALKSRHFDCTKTAAQIVATAPPIVDPKQFADLVSYWFSEDGKALSLRNKDRNWDTIVHTAGSKSFAWHAAELEKKNKFAPSRALLYVKTHTTRKDAVADEDEGVPVNDVAAVNIV